VRVCEQGHIRKSAKYAVEVNASTHAQHHTMLIMMMKTNGTSNVVDYIEKKMILKLKDGLGQRIFFCILETS
jgi:hypothetical protein